MNGPWKLICLVMALVLFFIAAVFVTVVPEPHRGRLIAAGLFFWVLSQVVS